MPIVQEMGRRHVGYGVAPADYETVGQALLWTLEQGLGTAWNETLEDSWSEAYSLLEDTMIDAAPSSIPKQAEA